MPVGFQCERMFNVTKVFQSVTQIFLKAIYRCVSFVIKFKPLITMYRYTSLKLICYCLCRRHLHDPNTLTFAADYFVVTSECNIAGVFLSSLRTIAMADIVECEVHTITGDLCTQTGTMKSFIGVGTALNRHSPTMAAHSCLM